MTTVHLQDGRTAVRADQIAGVRITTTGHLTWIHVHLCHSVPMCLTYQGSMPDAATADMRALRGAMA